MPRLSTIKKRSGVRVVKRIQEKEKDEGTGRAAHTPWRVRKREMIRVTEGIDATAPDAVIRRSTTRIPGTSWFWGYC